MPRLQNSGAPPFLGSFSFFYEPVYELRTRCSVTPKRQNSEFGLDMTNDGRGISKISAIIVVNIKEVDKYVPKLYMYLL